MVEKLRRDCATKPGLTTTGETPNGTTEQAKHELIEILDRRLDLIEAEHRDLLVLLEGLVLAEHEPEPEPVVADVEDRRRWMRDATRAMDEVIREVEGPRPRRGGRKN